MQKQEIFELIVHHTCQVIPFLKKHTFQLEDKLKELGANSLDRSEIIENVMEDLSLDIPWMTVSGAKDIGELAEILERETTNS